MWFDEGKARYCLRMLCEFSDVVRCKLVVKFLEPFSSFASYFLREIHEAKGEATQARERCARGDEEII